MVGGGIVDPLSHCISHLEDLPSGFVVTGDATPVQQPQVLVRLRAVLWRYRWTTVADQRIDTAAEDLVNAELQKQLPSVKSLHKHRFRGVQ